jgi:phytoene dehydrogenase-like protein
MNKVIIIGGGIAGLSAGIYAQQNGFHTEIYEKNPEIGGECTGWNRKGYHIDNCIHWLTGCRKGDGLWDIWKNVGALDENTKFYREPYFYMLDMEGRQLHFWIDLEKARKEFLALAPEDGVEIHKFFDSVKLAESLKIPCEKSPADMNFIEFIKFGMSMPQMGRVMKEYGKETVVELAQRFKNPFLRKMMGGYYNEKFMAVTLISSYAFFTGETAAIPMGGSKEMAQRMAKVYQALGGKLHQNMPVTGINIEGKKAVSVTFNDGSQAAGDYIISAADTSVTFGSLLDKKYMDKKLKKMYGCKEGYPVTSSFQAAFGILGAEDCGVPGGSVMFPCDSFEVGRQKLTFQAIRLYDYDESLFPKEKRVIQCNILQDERDYEYWKELYEDSDRYEAEKQRIADTVMKQIILKFPALEGRLVLLGTYSPITFERWCGAYKGAYMSFFGQKGYKSLYAKNKAAGLDNVFIASQWLQLNGGLPLAVTSGKFAAQAMRKR